MPTGCLSTNREIHFSYILIIIEKNFRPNYSYPIIEGDIYFGQSVITKYEARLDYTVFDLIAQFGGILGLTLGASVLSLAEVIYAGFKIIVILLIKKYFHPTRVSPKRKGKKVKSRKI